nr:hypothetical protein GCM10020093_054830 [Planobispora longispora]
MADTVVSTAVNLLTAAIGIAAAAGVLGVLHPVLLPLLVLAVLPDAWAAVRAARMRYTTMYALIPAHRRKWIIAELLANREPAAEVRSFTMRGFLMRMYDAVSRAEQSIMLSLARRQTLARLVGEALSGVGTAAVYVALGLLLAVGAVPLAVAGTAVLAIQSGKSSLANLMYATNRLYEEGLYFTDFLDFCADAETRVSTGRTAPAPRGSSGSPPTTSRSPIRAPTPRPPGRLDPHRPGRGHRARRRERLGQDHPRQDPFRSLRAGRRAGALGRHRPGRGGPRPGPRAHRGDRPGPHALAADRQAQHRHGHRQGEPALIAAAEVAGADQVVAELPYGYNTLLDRRFKDGQELSGGQWQRIAVARGFHRDALLLICDEPTAALDARAEHALFERIRRHADGRTVLLITHRLASVRYADRIYVLDHGKVTEQGTHARLMELDGLYAELYTLQARAYSA